MGQGLQGETLRADVVKHNIVFETVDEAMVKRKRIKIEKE